MSLRTLWVTNDLPPRAGGIEQFVGNLIRRTDPESAVVLGPANPDAAAHDAAAPYRVVRAPGGVWPTRTVVDMAGRLAARLRPDVVVLGASWPLGELAGRLREATGAPVAALSHGLEAGLADRGLGRLVGRATRDVAALTTISDWAEDRIRPHSRAGTIHRVPPGVDVGTFRPDVDGGSLRDRWGIPAEAVVVTCVSRLVRRKGQDVLLEVWPSIARTFPDAWLAIVGTGPLDEELRSTAARTERVVVTGEVAWADLPAAYAAGDVFAMPCRTRRAGTDVEGLGIVYLEAQATGKPVVAGRSGGAPEAVRAGETGYVVDGRDREELRRALGRLLADPSLRARMGFAGRAWVERTWAWDAIAGRFRDLLVDVAGSGRPLG